MILTCLEISPKIEITNDIHFESSSKIEIIIEIDWSGNFLGDCFTYAVLTFSQE